MSPRRSARLIASSGLRAAPSSSSALSPQPTATPASRGRKRKAGTDTEPDAAVEDSPATAPPASVKRRQKRTSTPPPPTPQSDNVNLVAEPTLPEDIGLRTPTGKKPRAAAIDRLADSNPTLATLLSPETSRIITSKQARAKARSSSASPTKRKPASRPAPEPTSARTPAGTSILEEANRHLIAVDPRMRPLVEKNHCRIFSAEGLAEKVDPFESLCSGIISQQVSGAAAAAIKKRFVALFYEDSDAAEGKETETEVETETKTETKASGDDDKDDAEPVRKRRFPHPSQVASMSIDKLRTAGLSQRKAEYVAGLAQKFVDGELSAQILADAPYAEVVERLTAVRGLGLWSAEMFACFGLKRIDVFSLGDLGVQRGMAAFVGRDVAKLKSSKGGKFKYMSEADMKELSDRFRPYRSLFMWYMWRVEATDVSTME